MQLNSFCRQHDRAAAKLLCLSNELCSPYSRLFVCLDLSVWLYAYFSSLALDIHLSGPVFLRCNYDVTAARNKRVYFSARLQPITTQESVCAWSTSCGVIVYCYFHAFHASFSANPPYRSLSFFLIRVSLYGFPRLFTVTSEHIRLFTF